MSDKWIVALDQGTSSCRAFAVDMQGQIRAQKHKIFSPHRQQKGFSEYNAHALLVAQQEVLHALLDEITPSRAAALAVCSQRSTVVLWRRHTGQAVAPVLTWEDGRASQQSQAVSLSQVQFHSQTGLFNTPYFSAPKIAWCLANFPAAKQAADANDLLVAPVASYLIWHLTAGQVFATDPTLAQRTLLWNIQTGTWSEPLCNAFGVPMHCLPQMRPTVADYGTYTYKGVTIPICVCVADQQAAVVHQRLQPGDTFVNYGTGAFVLHHAGKQLAVLPGMLSSVAACTDLHALQFLLEGPIFSAGSVLEWLKTKGVRVDYDHLDEQAACAQHPLWIMPALGGLGAPYWDYRVGPVVEQSAPHTTSHDWIAGVLQAIGARVADIVYYLRQAKFCIEQVQVAGGLSKSAYLLQAQADWLGCPVVKFPESESTVLGAAQLAADFLGWDTSLWQSSKLSTVFPRPSSSEAQQHYQQWQQFVQRCRQQSI